MRVALAILAGLAVLVTGARLFLLTPPGRALVVAIADGRSLGRLGRLGVRGLHGDVLSRFSLDEVTVSDARGVWLDARDLKVDWSPTALLGRAFHARSVSARTIRILRRPELLPSAAPQGPMPVSVRIRRFASDIELSPDFAKQYGRWRTSGDLDLARRGRRRGVLEAQSLTRPGDFLRLNFDVGGRDRIQLELHAREAQGGPIAGALGYSPNQPFTADVRAEGQDGKGGVFSATAASGAYTPLHATGRWTEAGGQASGVLAFAGSDLFKPFVDRVGPVARFDAAFQRRTDDRYDLRWTVTTDNLSSHGQGVVEAKPLRSQAGLRVAVSTPSASRLLGRKLAGAAEFDGILKGTPADWRLAGALTARDAVSDGYALASASGPVQVRFKGGRYDGEGRLQGAGGAGRGLIAGLLGARPKAELAASRLSDGRVVIQRLDLDGSNLAVRAGGGWGLLGGFSFEGQAEIPRVAALRRGGRGRLSATWRAAETGANRPWSLSLAADGRDFASGLGQLDRLLGPAPKLTATGRYQHGVVQLEKAALTGKSGEATGRGTAGLDGKLDLKLAWSARGPFEAGPVVLAGDARGEGALTGSLLRPKVDLTSRFDRIDLPDLPLQDAHVDLTFAKDPKGYDGAVSVHAASVWGPATAESRFVFTQGGLRLDQLAFDAGGVKAHGSVALNRNGPSEADLAFSAGPGAFLASGAAKGTVRLTAAAGAEASIDVAGSNLVFRNSPLQIGSLRLAGQGPLAHLPFTASATTGGSLPAKFSGTGLYSRTGATQTIALWGSGEVRGAAWRTLRPMTISVAPGMRSLDADLSVGGGRLAAQARQVRDSLDAKASLQGVDLAAVDSRLVGQVNATATASGRGARLTGTLEGRVQNLREADAPEAGAVNAVMHGSLAGDRLHLDFAGRDSSGGTATADVDLPALASAAPLHLAIARTRPMSGRFSIQGEVEPYWDLFVGGEDSLSGKASAQGTIGGTLDAPQVMGRASMQDARFQDARTGLDLRKLTASAEFNGESAVVQTFEAQDSHGGTVSGQGRLSLARGASSDFTLNLHRFQLLDNDQANARASGPLTVTRAADGKIKLAGKLRIDRAVISPNPPTPSGVVRLDVIEVHKPVGRGQDFRPPPTGPTVELDMTLNAPGQVLVQGRGLNLEFSLNAHVSGTTREPVLTGKAELVRGDYTFAGKRFDFDPNGVVDLDTKVSEMRLNLRAQYSPPTGSLTAVVNVRGTVAKPDIVITSIPSLPQDEILSQIIFGSSLSQLSTAQTAQIGAATASMAAGGGLDVLSNLREFAGLDVLTFGAEASSFTVTGGKYLGNNLYLEVVGGGQGGTSVQADWRVLKNLSIISQVAGQGYSKLSIFWRKDFH